MGGVVVCGRRRRMGVHERRWTPTLIRRGDIYLVDLEPVRGAESNKRRPAVVVSNDAANQTAARLGRGVITVVPVTSNLARVYPFQVLLRAAATGLGRDSKAQAEQIRSIAVDRLGDRLGSVSSALLLDIEDALRLHLAL
jgi:mRNA interferase MazF